MEAESQSTSPIPELWERLTNRSRKAFALARAEAEKRGETFIGPEHILLGILQSKSAAASQILEYAEKDLESLREELFIERNQIISDLPGDIALTAEARHAIDLAYREARFTNDTLLAPEHLLLGLLRDVESPAARTLTKRGIRLERARKVVEEMKPRIAKPRDAKQRDQKPSVQGSPREYVNNFGEHYGLRGTSLLSMADLSATKVDGILRLAGVLKNFQKNGRRLFRWQYPKSMAMVFEKPSLRTRVTFELGLKQLGGIPIVLGPEEIGLGKRESVEDAARNLERWVDGIMARVIDHQTLVDLAKHCKIPVINGLSDREHPCQALTDLFTIQEKKGELKGLKLAYIGDGNNVLHSLLLGGALVGMRLSAACPPGYEPHSAIVEQAMSLSAESDISVGSDPSEAVKDADVVYTDVWTSMGQEAESKTRLKAFKGYQVDSALMAQAKPDAIFMHCLPAHRGEEVASEVIDGPQAVVFDQAENRLHVQKAIMALLLGA